MSKDVPTSTEVPPGAPPEATRQKEATNVRACGADGGGSGTRGGVALVTGATGIVGRHIVMHLKRLGTWKILAIARSDKVRHFASMAQYEIPHNQEFFYHQLSTLASCTAASRL
jgi:NADPH:quinone reductase-like Zn-dependent oxidoreductase